MNRLRMRSSAALLVTLITGAACSRKGPSPSSPSETTAASLNERASEPVRGPGEATKPADPKGLVAFPGAEGYGAAARGGRGGKVCHVTSNKKEGPGTLDACLKMHGPRTVVFFGLTDPVIEGPLEIPEGALTLAGQTAPLGVTIRGGLVCDNVYDPNKCNDLVIRHVRFRAGAPDSLRLGGTHDVMIDHCSFAQADDENIEITRSKNISVQYSVVAEPEGEHYKWGGVLINYAKDVLPLDGISIHHTVWNGVAGRLPEISCEENGDGPGKTACSGRTLHIDLAHNVLFDTQDPIWYNRCTGTNEGNECAPSPKNFLLALNLVGNVMLRRAGSDAPLIEQAVWAAPGNRVYSADNHLFVGGKEVPVGGGKSAAARLPGPSIRETKASALVSELAESAGAFPRDAMDKRLAGYLKAGVDARPRSWVSERGVKQADAIVHETFRGALVVDADADGIDDAWEKSHGLDPSKDNSASLTFAKGAGARVPGCTQGYTALECYLNERAASIAKGSP